MSHKKSNHKKMSPYVSKERKRLEKELLMYLRKYRYFKSVFRFQPDLDDIINQIVQELKRDL